MSENVNEFLQSELGVNLGLEDHEIAGLAIAADVAFLGYLFYRTAVPSRALSVSDPRERMANQLIGRGHASVDEILKSSYGEWPPKGLNIVMDNPQRVSFGDVIERSGGQPAQNFVETVSNKFKLLNEVNGDATLGGERVIRMNNFTLSQLPGLFRRSALSSTLGHEGVHILQGDNFYRSTDTYDMSRQTASMYDGSDVNAELAVKGFFDDYIEPKDDKQKYGFKYLSEGVEIQARIHQTLMDGYKEWGQLPANKEQLLIALHDAGLNVPDEVRRTFENSTTFDETSRIFSGTGKPGGHVQQINSVVSRLSDEDKVIFFNKIMPEMYSDLIEMYGDKEGRARFDLGQNERFEARRMVMAQNYVDAQVDNHYIQQRISADTVDPPGTVDSLRNKALSMIDNGQIGELRQETEALRDRRKALVRFEEGLAKEEAGKPAYDQFERLYQEGGIENVEAAVQQKGHQKAIDGYVDAARHFSDVAEEPFDEEATRAKAATLSEDGTIAEKTQALQDNAKNYVHPVDRYIYRQEELAEARYNLEHTYEESRANPFTFDEDAARAQAKTILEQGGKEALLDATRSVRQEAHALSIFESRYAAFAEKVGLVHKNERGAYTDSAEVLHDLDRQTLQEFDALKAEGGLDRVHEVGGALRQKAVQSYAVARENLFLSRQDIETEYLPARSPGLPDNFAQTIADEVKEKIKIGGVESLKQSTQEMNAERRALSHYEGDLDRLSNKIADETGNKPEYVSGPEKLERFDALMTQGGVEAVAEEQQRLRVGKQAIRDYVRARDDNAGTKVDIEDGGVSYGTKNGLREPMVSPGTVDNITLRNELSGLLETDNPAAAIAEETSRLKQETDQLIRAYEAQSIAERNAADATQAPTDGLDHSDTATQTADLPETEQTVAEGNPVADHETAPETDVSQTAETGQTPDGTNPDTITQTTDVAGTEQNVGDGNTVTEPDVETAKIPDDPETVKAPEVTSTRMSAWGQSGGSAAGLAMGTVGLTNAIQSGDTTGMIVSGADVAVSGGDLALDAASAAGRTVSDALRGVASKANIAVMIADGAYQISREEGLENKVARGAAVVGTTGTAFAVGGTAATIGATGAAATAATVAAPVVAAVAVGMTADAAVDAYKVTEELEDSIKKNEQGVKVRDNVEQSGAPSLSNYRNLRVYAATEAESPDGQEGLNRREIAQRAREYEYSQDPAALDRLEEGLRTKVAEYDKVIEENDSMIHDSVRFFWASDEIDAQRMAKIDRAPYVAALNELEMYREELKSYEQEQAQAVEQKSELEQTAEQQEPEPIQLTQTFLDKAGSPDAVSDQPELEQAGIPNNRSTPGIENDVSDIIARIDSPAENQSPEISEHEALSREETRQVQSPDAGQDTEQPVTDRVNDSEVLETDKPALSTEVAPDEPDTPKDASVEAEPVRDAVTEQPQIPADVAEAPDHSESLESVQSDAAPVEPTDKPDLAEEPAESQSSTIVDESAPVVAEREKETAPSETDHSRMAIQGEGRGVEQFDSQVKELQEALIQADPKYKEILTYTNQNGKEVTADALEGWRTRKATDLYAQENNMGDPRQIPIDDFIDAVKNKVELTAEATTSQSITVDPKSFSGADATYSGDTALAAEAAEAGVEIDPELLQPGQMPVTGPVVAPQTSFRV